MSWDGRGNFLLSSLLFIETHCMTNRPRYTRDHTHTAESVSMISSASELSFARRIAALVNIVGCALGVCTHRSASTSTCSMPCARFYVSSCWCALIRRAVLGRCGFCFYLVRVVDQLGCRLPRVHLYSYVGAPPNSCHVER